MTEARRTLKIEFLYLDRTVCDRCVATGQALDAALKATSPALEALGIAVERRDLHVSTAQEAAAAAFRLSPTVRIDGHDVQPEAPRDRCGDCGTLCGCADGIDCRLWSWQGALHEAPPAALFVEAVLSAAIMGEQELDAGSVEPADNVTAFFAAREACCGGAQTKCC